MLPMLSRPILLPKLSEKEDVVVCAENDRGRVDDPKAGRGERSGEGESREKEGCS